MNQVFRMFAAVALFWMAQKGHAAWSTPADASDGSTEVYGIAIAENNLGNAVIIWEDNGAPAIYANLSSNSGSSWGTQIEIGAPSTAANDANPGAAIDPSSSKAIGTWSSANSGGVSSYVGEIYASVYSGSSWGSATAISGNGSTQNISSQTPATIMNSGGTAAVAWYDEGVNEVIANYYNGSSWAGAQSLSTGITGTVPSSGNVSMATNGGKVIAVWAQTVSGTSSIYSNYSSNGGSSWGIPELVFSDSNAYNPTVSINSSGTAFAIWETDVGGGLYEIFAADSSNGGGWSGAAMIGTSHNNSGSNVFSYPQISLNNSGDAVMGWTNWSTDTGPSAINYVTYNGSTFSSAISLGSSGLQAPLVTLNNSGDSVIAAYIGSNPYTIEAFTSLNSGITWSSSSSLITNSPYPNFGLTLNSASSSTAIAAVIAPGGGNQIAETSYFSFSSGPNPPSSIAGSRKTNVFPFQTDNYNLIEWSASSTSDVTGYYVFRNGIQIGVVSASDLLQYLDHDIERDLSYTYTVTAVDSSGQSSAVAITI